MTPQEFLAWEATQSQRFELANGSVVTMAGGNASHNEACLSIASAFKQHLKGKACKVFITDKQLAALQTSSYFYPDIMVSCAAVDTQDPTLRRITQPKRRWHLGTAPRQRSRQHHVREH
jgi:Uma2 family endonuclease